MSKVQPPTFKITAQTYFTSSVEETSKKENKAACTCEQRIVIPIWLQQPVTCSILCSLEMMGHEHSEPYLM